jgi:predicted kinase
MALAGDVTVILDAAHLAEAERDQSAGIASAAGVRFDGFWLDAPEDLLKRRVSTRAADASDATASVVEKQTGYDLGTIGWHRLWTDRDPKAVTDMAISVLDG